MILKNYNTKDVIKAFAVIKCGQADRMQKILPKGVNKLSPKNTSFWVQQARAGRTEPILLRELPETIQKTENHMPKITNGKIEFQDFADYVMQCATDQKVNFDQERLRKLLFKPSWRAFRVSDEPLVLNMSVLFQVEQILAS